MYLVVREYSHTDKRHLLAIESTYFRNKENADDWLRHIKGNYPKSKCYVIQICDITCESN